MCQAGAQPPPRQESDVVIPDPHAPQVILDELRAAGYRLSPEGIRAALASGKAEDLVAGLRVARMSGDPSFLPLIEPIEFHPSRDVRIQVVAYQATCGDEDALEILHAVADSRWNEDLIAAESEAGVRTGMLT